MKERPLASFNDSVYYTDSIDEHPEYEYELPALNLGAETPVTPHSAYSTSGSNSILDDEWASLRAALQKHNPIRPTMWRSRSRSRSTSRSRSNSFTGKRAMIDVDCGICFEKAVKPCRTLCCSKIFCQEHIADWLDGSSSDGRCPACKAPCTMAEDTQTFALVSPSPKQQPHHPNPPQPPCYYPDIDQDSSAHDSISHTTQYQSGLLFSDSFIVSGGSSISSGPTSISSSSDSSSNRSHSLSPALRPNYNNNVSTSIRQRRSSSHLYASYHTSPYADLDINSDSDEHLPLNIPIISTFMSPATFVLISRITGRILSLVGLLLVLYVVLGRGRSSP